jgi:RHS repeat-associated protein
VLTYTYDNDSRVTAMTWTLSGNTVANLQYQYDADGRVLQKSSAGSFAQSQLPSPVTANTFNAANEMTSFNGTALTYDANGNLTNDGTDRYTWDARNHLVGISGANTASFVYDAEGRRALKSIGGTSTNLLYDGLNPVQELQSGAPSANMLTGLGIDEFFQRVDSGGTHDYLSDILGSTVALTSTSGSIQQQYTYQPFGGPASGGSNPYQFTGRENDGTGLYFNRARYYNPTLQRFISQDPLDFEGGDTDLYSYAGDQPISLRDPTGMQAEQVCEEFPSLCDPTTWWPAVAGLATAAGAALLKSCHREGGCRPCDPPVGTIAYRFDPVPPSKPHYPYTGSHYHIYIMQQNPNNCQCFWSSLGASDTPQGIPISPAGGGGFN